MPSAASPNPTTSSVWASQTANAEEALLYVKTEGQLVDLFLLDIRLPGKMTGLDLAQDIRDLHCPGFMVIT